MSYENIHINDGKCAPAPAPGVPLLTMMEKANAIADTPTVDAVEVVRCRNCRFAHRVDGPREKYSCAKGNYCTPWLNGDDFCSNGERRADE